MKKLLLVLISVITMVTGGRSQLQVFPNLYTPSQLVLDVLITGCLQASNVVYTGDMAAKGYFTYSGPVSSFPFTNGVILSSGSAIGAAGPNSSGSSTTLNNGGPYPLLATVITGGSTNTNNSSVLEFDFIPADNVIDFRYIFGSDEYPEYVNSSFNDVFAFFLTGPNPTGPAYVNKNIAIVPTTTNTAVSINNVNAGSYSAYYITNTLGVVQYDGYTTALTAHATVTPCANYHIRLAIADVGDTAYDSGVFLEGGSMISGEVVQMQNYNPVGDDNVIYEGCENYYVFERTDPTDVSTPILVLLNLSGTASPTADITGFPVSLTIPIGQVSDTIYYSAIMDNISEGTEYLVFTLLNGCPCTVGSTRDTIWIYDNLPINAGIIDNDTLICSSTPVSVVLNSFTNTPANITHYQWTGSSGIVSNPTYSSITVTPPVGQISTYMLQVTDDCGQVATDQVQITVSNMSTINVQHTNLTCYNVCTGSISVIPSSGFPPYTYGWFPPNSGSVGSGIANNLCSGVYVVTVTDQFGCKTVGGATLTQPPQVLLSFTTDPSTCPGANDGEIHINVTNGVPPFTFSCTGIALPVTVNSNTYTFVNMNSGNYTINVTDATNCHAQGIVNVGQLSLTYSTNVNDATCYNKSDGSASINVAGGTVPYSYHWSSSNINSSSINGLHAGNYLVTVTDSHNCNIVVPISIDHPDSLTIINSEDTIICRGESAVLSVSANGGTTPYSYYWNNTLAGSSVTVTPPVTTSYSVYSMDDNNCRSVTNLIKVNVYPSVSLTTYATEDSICKGDSVLIYLMGSGGNGGPYRYYMNNIEVSSPIMVNPEITTIYTFVAKDNCGSPQGNSKITIHIMNAPESDITISSNRGCSPLVVEFNDLSSYEGQTYEWIFGDNSVSFSHSPLHTYLNAGVYDISLITTSKFGCQNRTILNGEIIVLQSPTADFIADPSIQTIFNPVIVFENRSTFDGHLSEWDFGDNTSDQSSELIFQHVYRSSGVYNVILAVSNLNECTDTISKIIEIQDVVTFWAPNAISPEGSKSENKYFRIFGYGISPDNYHLAIFDRWGGKVFETYDINHFWDGKVKDNKYIKSGGYTWIVTYYDIFGNKNIKSGIVFVLF